MTATTEQKLREAIEKIAEDFELKGHHPCLDPDSEEEAGARDAYRDAGRRLRSALSSSPSADDEGRGRATLGFDDALRIARGCTDYGGGHRGNEEHFAIYQHGIGTVITALTAAAERGLADTQIRVLHRIGSEQPGPPATEQAPDRARDERP